MDETSRHAGRAETSTRHMMTLETAFKTRETAIERQHSSSSTLNTEISTTSIQSRITKPHYKWSSSNQYIHKLYAIGGSPHAIDVTVTSWAIHAPLNETATRSLGHVYSSVEFPFKFQFLGRERQLDDCITHVY